MQHGLSWSYLVRGTVPDGSTYGFIFITLETHQGHPVPFHHQLPKQYLKREPLTKPDIYTYSVKYGARSPTTEKPPSKQVGHLNDPDERKNSFGSSVYSPFYSGRDSGTTPTVKIRLRRQNSTPMVHLQVYHQPSGVAHLHLVELQEVIWTPWVTIPGTPFTSSGTHSVSIMAYGK